MTLYSPRLYGVCKIDVTPTGDQDAFRIPVFESAPDSSTNTNCSTVNCEMWAQYKSRSSWLRSRATLRALYIISNFLKPIHKSFLTNFLLQPVTLNSALSVCLLTIIWNRSWINHVISSRYIFGASSNQQSNATIASVLSRRLDLYSRSSLVFLCSFIFFRIR